MSDSVSMSVLMDVLKERKRQDEKWGYNRDHPDHTGYEGDGILAEYAKGLCDIAAQSGSIGWREIMFEEMYEAFAESDEDRLREELIQVAAVAVAWIEALDARKRNAS